MVVRAVIDSNPAPIDPGYRGEIRVILPSLGPRAPLHPGRDRIAQIAVARHESVEWDEHELSETRRGSGG
jgi:dUTP pyrophosphatase